MPHRSAKNNYYQLPIALLAIAIVLLLGVSIFVLTPKIQTDLAEKIQKELVENKIPADITLSGRDVILRGIVRNEEVKEKAEAITEKVCGIRFVDNQLLTDKPENRIQFANNNNMVVSDQQSELERKPEPEKKLKPENKPESEIKSEPQPAKEEQIKNIKEIKVAKEPSNSSVLSEDSTSESAISEGTKSTELEMPLQTTSSESSLAASTDNDTSTNDDSLVLATNRPTSINKVEAEKVESPTESTTEKRKILDYDTMLAAMNAYNKQKGRNPARRLNIKKIDLSFKKGSKELLNQAQENTALNDLADSLKKDKKTSIEVIVTAVSSKLAIDRAKTIQSYLVTKGVDLKRVSITGKSGSESVEVKETNR